MKKEKVKTFRDPSVSITLRKPDKSRKSFTFTAVVVNQDGTRTQKKMNVPELESINSNFHSKLINYNQAISLIEQIKIKELRLLKVKHGLNEDESLVIHQSNKKLVSKYLKEEYSKRISLKDVTKKSIKTVMNQVLRVVGPNSLITTDQVTLQHVVNNNKDYSKETVRRLVCRINNLLSLAGRDFKLSKPEIKKKRFIPHITEDELPIFLSQLNNHIDIVAAKIIFYTGLRTGELFALEEDDIDFELSQIDVTKQLTREFNVEDPKCNKDRTVIFPSFIAKELKEWLDFNESYILETRNRLSKRFLTASRKCWGKSKKKDISPHDLRRSFAIHLITEKNFSITEVSQLLGDTEKVTQDYYAGYAATDKMLQNLLKKIG